MKTIIIIIDIAVRGDARIEEKEKEKLEKYHVLAVVGARKKINFIGKNNDKIVMIIIIPRIHGKSEVSVVSS